VREWTFKDLDRDKLDLEKLRQHIPADALDKAVRSFVKAGGRELAGCTIFDSRQHAGAMILWNGDQSADGLNIRCLAVAACVA